MNNSSQIEGITLSYCHACRFDLRAASTTAPSSYDQYATVRLRSIGTMLDRENSSTNEENIGHLEVLRHLCTLMTTNYKYIHLREYVSKQLGIEDIPLTPGKVWFEARPIDERHHLIQLALWLFVDLETRLHEAWKARAVRYNLLLKDFSDPPSWYMTIVRKFSNWRDRFG